MFGTLEKNASHILMSVATLFILLVILFALLHLASKHAPSPIAGLADKAAGLATPASWEATN